MPISGVSWENQRSKLMTTVTKIGKMPNSEKLPTNSWFNLSFSFFGEN